MEKDEYEARRGGPMCDALGEDGAGGALMSLRLRSRRALLCLGGRSSLAMLRTWISEKEPEDCRMRGRRLRAFADALWGVFVAAGLWALRAIVAGESWTTHSSERSSSHGCVVLLAMLVVMVVVSAGCRVGRVDVSVGR